MKKTLANYYFLFMLIFIALIIVIITSIYNNAQNTFLEATVEDIRENVVNQYKEELKDRTEILEKHIVAQKRLAENRLRQSILSRVEEAHAIANNLHKKYKDKKSPKDIQEIIVESLRSIRFNNARGYFFIDDIDGNCMLYPIATKLEGTNLLNVQDVNKKYVIKEFVDIAKEKGAGFSVYYSNKYKVEKGDKYKKVTYIKLFKPYNMIIGTGEYLKDVEEDIKKELIKEIENFKGINNNISINIFEIHNFKGGKDFATIIVNQSMPNLVGTKISSNNDKGHGKNYKEKCLSKINKDKKGFISYKYKKINEDKTTEKLTYVKRLKYWDWVLSHGVDFDNLEKIIKINQEKAEYIQKEGNIKTLITLLVVFVILSMISFFVSKNINMGYQNIINFFRNAALKKEKIDTSKFLSDDFKTLGNFANEMIETIHYKREKLTKLNEKLEQSVEIKTIELQTANKFLEYKNIELERNYYTDSLTKLSNRNKFIKNLENCEDVTVIIFDIDGFKNINDFYGIKTGDYLLKELSKFISVFANRNKMVTYRLSSDEFLISIDKKISKENLQELSDNFCNEFGKNYFYDETNKIKLNVSLTYAMATGKESILSRVNLALNYAKQNKLTCAIYDKNNSQMNRHKQNIYWREKIQFAIDNNLIEPYFQRIVNTNNDKEKKYEALMRIIDEDNIITPYYFLNISKETKQYPYLTKTMIEKTFKRFQNEEVEFSINISMLDVENDETIKFLRDKIVEYKVEKKLILEILETEDMLNSEKFLPFVNSMRKIGVRFALDDFGSGYSNFAFLLKMHPKFLKIDGSLIKNITHDNNSLNIVKTIVLFAKQIDATVIAEFVENDEIVKILKELDVNYMQGYHFSKPSPEI